MGFFGRYLYDGARWTSLDPAQQSEPAEPWLLVDIHDSDIAAISYRPAGPGSGLAFLGHTPRTYFEDDAASEPIDVQREAAGLTAWWAALNHGVDEAGRRAKEAELAGYLAEDLDPAEFDWDEDEDVDELDDGEIFVEVKAGRFLRTLGLPVPDGLPGGG